jgi:hypothetical protein
MKHLTASLSDTTLLAQALEQMQSGGGNSSLKPR